MAVYTPSSAAIQNLATCDIGKTIVVSGWVRNCRIQTAICFIEISDGGKKTLQCVSESPVILTKLQRLTIGASISVRGELVASPAPQQPFELRISEILYLGLIEDPAKFLLCGKRVGLDTLREHQHLRARTRTFGAIFRIRAGLSAATHAFFDSKGFYHLNPNIVTTSDCEGAGEVFTITNLCKEKPPTKWDFTKDFFGKHAFLTVSSQLQLETLCAGLGRVWTSNKSFRAEASRTNRHLAEFEHIEWEFAWCGLEDLMNLSEEYTQFCFRWVLDRHAEDIAELEKFVSRGLGDKLRSFVSGAYKRITYDEALRTVQEHGVAILAANPGLTLPVWGDDIGSVCEKWLCERVYSSPLFVYNYPKALKSFYMKQNDDGRTVQACDLLIPGLGELIGSSVREDSYTKLLEAMSSRGMDVGPLEWYVDLRRNGSFPHAGAGLGFDRLVSICSLMEGNIRDVVPFPVAYQECRM